MIITVYHKMVHQTTTPYSAGASSTWSYIGPSAELGGFLLLLTVFTLSLGDFTFSVTPFTGLFVSATLPGRFFSKMPYAEFFVTLAPDEFSATFAMLYATDAMVTGGLLAASYPGLLFLALNGFSTTPYAGLFVTGAAAGTWRLPKPK